MILHDTINNRLKVVLEKGFGLNVVTDGYYINTISDEEMERDYALIGKVTEDFPMLLNYRRFSELREGTIVRHKGELYMFKNVSKYGKVILCDVNDLSYGVTIPMNKEVITSVVEVDASEEEQYYAEMFDRYDISKVNGIKVAEPFTLEMFKEKVVPYMNSEVTDFFYSKVIIGDYRNVPLRIMKDGVEVGGLTRQVNALNEHLDNIVKQHYTLEKVTANFLNLLCGAGLPSHLQSKLEECNDFRLVDAHDEEVSMIKYYPSNKKVDWNGGKVKPTHTLSIYKYLVRTLKDHLTEYEIKQIGDRYVALNSSAEVIEVDDETIPFIYQNTCDASWNTSSCMRDKPKEFFDLYIENKAFKLFVIVKGEEIVGRFLKVFAKDARTHEDFVYADRLYYKNETVRAFFHKWCRDNGLYRKAEQSAGTRDYFYGEEGCTYRDIYVELDENLDMDDYGSVPYLDTVSYSDGKNTLYNYEADEATRIYDKANGSYTSLYN